jgi:HEAT repeat protein
MEALKAAVLRQDPAAYHEAKSLGKAAIPALRELVQHEDAGVRRIALTCVGETGAPEAVELSLAALADGDEQVAAVAVGNLQPAVEARHQGALFQGYDKSPYGLIRGFIALLVGKLDKAADAKELQKRLKAEQDPDAQEYGIVALAKLGDKPSQEAFVSRLQASQGRERRRILGHARYIGAAWLLKPLLPLLDDPEPQINLNVDGMPGPQKDVRSCDLAATLAAKLSGKKFSFPVEEHAIYSAVQLDEVRKFLKTAP